MHAGGDYLTKEKFQEFEKELKHLKTVKRKEVAEALEYAKSLGDLSENQEYQEARDSQAILEDRINRLEAILKSAQIISTKSTNIVSVGSVVALEKESDKSRKSYTMVGSEEADLAADKISYLSPIGSSLLGKKKGEKIAVLTPKGEVSYKIISIE